MDRGAPWSLPSVAQSFPPLTPSIVATVAVVLLVALAGCSVAIPDDVTLPGDDEAEDGVDAGDGPRDANPNETTADGDSPGDPRPATSLAPAIEPPGPAPASGGDVPPSTPQADPESDVLGWEDGYWYNDPVAAEAGRTLDESELEAVVARAMARVEYVRGREFEQSVDVSVVSRDEFGTDQLGGNVTAELRTFDNAKFEALFLVGGDDDSVGVQDEALNATVGGYYSSDREAIVIVADEGGANLTTERTLAHELVHAIQDQHFGDAETPARLRDAYNGRNGLYEGDATVVENLYMERCENGRWRCLAVDANSGEPAGEAGEAGDVHLGVHLIDIFPYTDGPGLVAHLGADRGWASVDEAYDRLPTSATEVIYPDRYGTFEPRTVELADDPRGGWERVRPPDRPDYGRLGQSALVAAFAYTLFDDYNRASVVPLRDVVNVRGGGLDPVDPFDYDLAETRGWTGDRLYAYERDGETASVWRLTWESPAAAERFADGYRNLLRHWGGERVGPSTWRIDAGSPFAGAASLHVDGDQVTVVKTPDVAALGEVYPGAR